MACGADPHASIVGFCAAVRATQGFVFYPASGTDGDPVRHFGGHFLSFVYADYALPEKDFLRELKKGFRGYRRLFTRRVEETVLAPSGWPTLSLTKRNTTADERRKYERPFLTPAPFYAYWAVFVRKRGQREDHGPQRLSLLQIAHEGVEAFQALYVANSIAPRGIAVIQPGTGFGGNWTSFENPQGVLARMVCANPAGRPQYLLYGGIGEPDFYRDSCWPEYSHKVCSLLKGGEPPS